MSWLKNQNLMPTNYLKLKIIHRAREINRFRFLIILHFSSPFFNRLLASCCFISAFFARVKRSHTSTHDNQTWNSSELLKRAKFSLLIFRLYFWPKNFFCGLLTNSISFGFMIASVEKSLQILDFIASKVSALIAVFLCYQTHNRIKNFSSWLGLAIYLQPFTFMSSLSPLDNESSADDDDDDGEFHLKEKSEIKILKKLFLSVRLCRFLPDRCPTHQ